MLDALGPHSVFREEFVDISAGPIGLEEIVGDKAVECVRLSGLDVQPRVNLYRLVLGEDVATRAEEGKAGQYDGHDELLTTQEKKVHIPIPKKVMYK